MLNARLMALAACVAMSAQAASAQSAGGEGPSDANKLSTEERAWLDHGLTKAQRDSIRAACQWGIDSKFVPGGAILIIHRGEPVMREGFGVADLETKRPFTPDLPCRIASVTKPHISTLMAMLAEKGLLSLDDPVDKYLPVFSGVKVQGKGPATRAPRIHELLSHTAGLPGKSAPNSREREILAMDSLEAMCAELARQGLISEPGAAFCYATVGFRVAERIAEIRTGKEFGALMDEMLLKPIGSTTATFHPSKELAARLSSLNSKVLR